MKFISLRAISIYLVCSFLLLPALAWGQDYQPPVSVGIAPWEGRKQVSEPEPGGGVSMYWKFIEFRPPLTCGPKDTITIMVSNEGVIRGVMVDGVWHNPPEMKVRHAFIREWAASGEICRVIGHRFDKPYCDQVITSHPQQYLWKRKCSICGKVQHGRDRDPIEWTD